MSAPVRIPTRRPPLPPPPGAASSSSSSPGESSAASSSSSTPVGSSYVHRASHGSSSPLSESYRSPTTAYEPARPEVGFDDGDGAGKGKGAELSGRRVRGESLIGPALANQTHTVIDTGRPDGPPRLTSFVRMSQGFEWNPDIFLPTRSPLWGAGAGGGLERRREVAVDIVLSDEEARELLPE